MNMDIRPLLNKVTADLTAFPTFPDLINAGGNYRPSLKASKGPNSREAVLADIYDQVQEARGDNRRAFRY